MDSSGGWATRVKILTVGAIVIGPIALVLVVALIIGWRREDAPDAPSSDAKVKNFSFVKARDGRPRGEGDETRASNSYADAPTDAPTDAKKSSRARREAE